MEAVFQTSANLWWVFLLLLVLALLVIAVLGSSNSKLENQRRGTLVFIYDCQKCDVGECKYHVEFFPGIAAVSHSAAVNYLRQNAWEEVKNNNYFWKNGVFRARIAAMNDGPFSISFEAHPLN